VVLANGLGRADMAWDGRRLTVTAWGGRDDRGNGTVLQRNRMSGGTASVTFDAAGPKSTFAARVAVSPNDFHQTFSAVFSGRNREILVLTQNIDTLTTRGIVEFGHSLPEGHVLVRGTVSRASADFEAIRSTSTSFQSLSDRSESISVQSGFAPASNVTLGAGLRHERRAAPTSTAGRDGATVGHARLAWRPESTLELRGSVASSHRWPTLNELVRGFRVGDVITLANLDLLPERAVSADGALSLEGPRWQASFGGFWTRVDDAIANVTLSEDDDDGILRQRQNSGRTRARGVELDAEFRPGLGSRIRTSVAFVDARFVESADPGLDGNRVPQVPRVSFTLATDVPLPERMTFSAVLRAMSSQFDDDRNRFELGPAAQLDLRLAGRVGWFGWHVELENVFDAVIEVGRTPVVTLAPPRSVRVGFGVRAQ